MHGGTKRTILPLCCALALLIGLLPLAAPTAAATFTAFNHGDDIDADLSDNKCNAPGIFQGCTLRAAIMQLNALGPGPHTLTLEPGVYNLTIDDTGGSDEELATTGDLDIRSKITIGVEGTGTATIVVKKNPTPSPTHRAFEVHPGASLTLSAVTIDGGAFGNASPERGGGIANAGTLNMTGGAIIDSSDGGFHNTGTATLSGTDVRDNFGGGIRNAGTLTLKGKARVRDNAGTGILNESGRKLVVEESTISGNSGGGIINNGTLEMDETTVDGNSTTSCCAGGIVNKGQATIAHSTVSHNTSRGIENSGTAATLALTNSTISGNGGGLFLSGGSTTDLNMVTVTRNTGGSAQAGGIRILSPVGSPTVVRMANTIVADNPNVGNGPPDCQGPIISLDYNLVGINSGCFTPQAHDRVGTPGNPLDPRLLPLANNGGKTKTHALDTGSQAVENGNPAPPGSAPGACTISLAQNGVFRILDSNGDNVPVCDIGAFEQP